MTTPYTHPEGVTRGELASFGTPTGWWDAEAVIIRGETDPEIVYLLSGIGLNPLDVVDTRRRWLIEAFTALPLTETFDAIADYWASRKRKVDLFRAQSALRSRSRELVDFVHRFGPVGVGWGARLALRGPSRADSEGDRSMWYADFTNVGPGRFGMGSVKRVPLPAPDATEQDLLRSDRTMPADRLARLIEEQRDLVAAVDLARLVIDGAAGATLREACRKAARGSPDHRQTLDLGKSSPWRRALTKAYPERAEIAPFGSDAPYIRWRDYAPLVLGELITRQLSWLQLRAEALPEGSFARSVRPTSLVELMYLQLLERLEKRRQLGLSWCVDCSGAIFRRRARDAFTRVERHPGCNRNARVARHRAR